MPKLQSSFCRIASAGLGKKSAVDWQSTTRFGTGTAGSYAKPNAKASIQLLPDCFRRIGEIKTPLTGKALLALAPEQPGVMQRLLYRTGYCPS